LPTVTQALSKYQRVETVAFDYGQRHIVELDARLNVLREIKQQFRSGPTSWALAHSLGGQALVDVIVEHTRTCYLGDRAHRHAWGYGCGTCPACELRARVCQIHSFTRLRTRLEIQRFRDEVLGGRSGAHRNVLVYVRIASTAQRRSSPEK